MWEVIVQSRHRQNMHMFCGHFMIDNGFVNYMLPDDVRCGCGLCHYRVPAAAPGAASDLIVENDTPHATSVRCS